MRVLVYESDIKAIAAEMDKDDGKRLMGRHGHSYRSRVGNGKYRVEISGLSDKSLTVLYDFLDKKAKDGDRSSSLSRGQVKQWMELKKNPGGESVTKLEAVESAMKEYVDTSENKYLFEQCDDGNMVPWFVSAINYNSPSKYNPASVKIHISFYERGGTARNRRGDDGKTITILSEDFRGKTMSELLQFKGYYLETPERMESYREEVEKWAEHESIDGFQMSVTGKGYKVQGWYGSGYTPVGHDGAAAKMVVDPPDKKEGGETSVECELWGDYFDIDEEKDEDATLWELPIQPVIRMFDLTEHEHYRIHVNNMVPYEYDKNVGDKLVLPADVKDFVGTLIEHSGEVFEDIVQGKSGGTVVLIEGAPGIGKTLTAEVYAEVMERPLYKVQSSQLGTSPKELEDELGTVLERAARWGAILLIDEADVYVYERGADIIQNAIVGVFLRVLEYYRGVLFMTTNRGTNVDDAIISRLTARLTYEMPGPEDQKRLWRILAAQNGMSLSDGQLEEIVKNLPGISGRDIKNLLKLALVVGRKREGDFIDHLAFVRRFKQTRKAE